MIEKLTPATNLCAWCVEKFGECNCTHEEIVTKDDEGKPVCEHCADDYRSECDTTGEMP